MFEPDKPVELSELSELSGPVGPVEPVEPVGPAKPAKPAESAKSTKSTKPAKSTKSAKPASALEQEYVPLWKDLLQLLLKVAFIAIAIAAVFTFVFGAYRVTDTSMTPSIKDGDLVLYYRLHTKLRAQDVVVLNYEGTTTAGRIVAVAGDKVDITSDGLMVNGSHQVEQGITQETTQVSGGVTFPLTVPTGSVFVLGDNRGTAVDSRIFGCVPEHNIYGQVIGLFRRRGI